ncbi:hypothetical protein I302_107238 [Kwoniella bestiolae CBS 10118]|uniref:Uncharacterized protein n=1 Tax=Kwoniella bestiolae CBS 10118 TaxID=1296100 RepID=A0A1B9FZ58_9TREE|nr:hypothetical protein I302_07027 [Kwoniella bestiolae CBS 10118]OCF24041.1 hypothetical protein I302_07027 [Kwoniella bestiolae CBS 10118]
MSPSPKTTDEIASHLFARSPPPLEPGTRVYAPELTKPIAGLKEHMYVIAALHLANDDIHHCHLIAQDNEGDTTANLLHATLHRREGDYWNSKYWWSNVRSHPLIPSTSDAKSFVDSCETVKKNREDDTKMRERQWDELKKIVEWTRSNYKS